jgi:hypothetical protein
MYKLSAVSLGFHKDQFVAYGDTQQEVIAEMFVYLQRTHPSYIGQNTPQRLAEIDQLFIDKIEHADTYFGKKE